MSIPTKPLHISVASTPKTDVTENSQLFEKELQITKAAILYGDKVTLISPGVSDFFDLLQGASSASELKEKCDFFIRWYERCVDGDFDLFHVLDVYGIKEYRRILNKPPSKRSKRENLIIPDLENVFAMFWNSLCENIGSTVAESRANELVFALNAGLLEIPRLPYPNTARETQFEYLAMVCNFVARGDTSPMFDDWTRDVIRQILRNREGYSESDENSFPRRKIIQSTLTANLFERLPIIDIPMDELLDVRKDLSKALVAFRAEISQIADSIENEAWDADLSQDIEKICETRIAPAILEIEDNLDALKLINYLPRRLSEKSSLIMPAIVGMGAISGFISPAAAVIAGIVSAGITATAAIAELKERYQEIQRNGLYFYYQVGQHAERRKKKS